MLKLTERDGIIVPTDTKVAGSSGSRLDVKLDYTTMGLVNNIHKGVYKVSGSVNDDDGDEFKVHSNNAVWADSISCCASISNSPA